MSFSADITITENNAAALAAQLEPRIKAVLLDGAQRILDNAAAMMQTYPPASSPGEPPAKRTGELATDTEVNDVGPLEVTAQWNAPYAAAVNYGTRKMAARPFAEPAVELTIPEIEANLQDVLA